METGFGSLRAAFDKLRQEFKHKIEEMKRKVTSLNEFYTELGGHAQGEVEGKHEGNEGWSGKSQHERSTAEKEIGTAIEENIKRE